jgi:hypothetical protein
MCFTTPSSAFILCKRMLLSFGAARNTGLELRYYSKLQNCKKKKKKPEDREKPMCVFKILQIFGCICNAITHFSNFSFYGRAQSTVHSITNGIFETNLYIPASFFFFCTVLPTINCSKWLTHRRVTILMHLHQIISSLLFSVPPSF